MTAAITLSLYIARQFTGSVIAMLLALCGLVAMFDFIELLRRSATKPDATFALVSEIAADRSALITIMTTLQIKVRGYKMFAAWAGEKAGRLKFNGHLLSRSPLSDLEETEMLRLGVEGKAAGWRTLRELAGAEPRLSEAWLDELLTRARAQGDLLEDLRVRAARHLLEA